MPRTTKRSTAKKTRKSAKLKPSSALVTKRKPQKATNGNRRKVAINHWRPDVNNASDEWHDAFLNHYAKTLNVLNAAALTGVSRRTVYNHLEQHPDFAERFEEARMSLVEQVEAVGFKLALKGDAGMIRFLLTHNDPERYQPPKAVIVLTPELLASLSDDDLQLLKAGADPAHVFKNRKPNHRPA